MKDGLSIKGRVTVGHTIYAFRDGGMERGLLNLVNHSDPDRFRHVLLCLTEAGPFAGQVVAQDCEIIELRKREGNDLRLPGRIAAAARQHRVDILHARGWPALVETAFAARLARIRATIYGFHGKTLQDLYGMSLKRRWAQRAIIRYYHRVVTLNRRMRSDLAAECKLPEDRIHIISNGVDVDMFRPLEDRGRLRAMFGLPADRFILGNVARLDPVKNIEVILRALCRLRRRSGKPPFLLLVGEGSHRAALEAEIKILGITEDVHLFGYSDRIPELLNCMDVYIQSSFYEGFSNTVLEAMACGLPVIASDRGGTADVFSDGWEGFLFPAEDDEILTSRVIQIEEDSFLRRTMAMRARRLAVERFSVQSMVHNYETMYLELASAPNH